MLADSARLVTAGIDTHKDVHVAAVVNDLGAEIATGSFPATADGHQALVAWLYAHGDLDRVGVEGCGSWGAGIARYLTSLGVPVVEINRPNRQTRHNQGKSDPLDAISAAGTALAGLDAGIPKTGGGRVESICVLRNTWRSAVRDPDPIFVGHCPCRGPGEVPGPDQTDELLTTIVVATAPNLVVQTGVGIDTAAALVVAAGGNPDRLGSEAAFAWNIQIAARRTRRIKDRARKWERRASGESSDTLRTANHGFWPTGKVVVLAKP